MSENEEFESFPLRTELDNAILMHRDVHFGGDFNVMLEYYQKGGKGVCQDFEIEQVQNLHNIEIKTKKNLAPLLLTGPEAEKVARAKTAYKKLRELYEENSLSNKYPLLIADLILSEEEDPQGEINAIVKKGGTVVSSLLNLLRAEDFYDPLFPGYGCAPVHAAKCLGEIGDKRAIISLFETIGSGDFFNEDILLGALKTIGQPAKDFLKTVVKSRPLNADNERAAIALLPFKDDPDVAETCLHLLLDPEVRSQVPLSAYLVLACEGLTKPQDQSEFLALASDPATSSTLVLDIKTLARRWE